MFNIYVGNLPYSTTEQDLAELFGQYGQVAKTSIIIDRESGRSRGFGFAEMPNDEEGQAAITALNGFDLDGRKLTVNEARPREAQSSGRGGYGGSSGGGSGGGSGGSSGGSSGGFGGGYRNRNREE